MKEFFPDLQFCDTKSNCVPCVQVYESVGCGLRYFCE